ncbi:hypothetical protein CYY_004746 [Polysphondylium violaceum]|uniref:Uncharacterized protein n=1 Tax=Polysphondylium violaceum TaxID=133409 RepID=A0A8J4PXL2_9MYCE|nr:hypothetical protein CYY_004746 [Polysphondylium violaceum]
MLFNALSSISNPMKSISNKTVNNGSSASSSIGKTGNQCWYIIGIGGATVWVDDSANPHSYHMGYPPGTFSSSANII